MNATLPGSSLKDFARVLACFGKIGDEISLEVKTGKLLLSTLNSSKSAFILVTLNASRFERFEYIPMQSFTRQSTQGLGEDSLRCKLQLRALLSIFRSRNIESKETRESSVEKCEFKLLHPSEDAAECQLLLRLVCKHGVRKTYKLQYETTQTMHAVADRTVCHNQFSIPARALKDVMDHFAPRAEELTLAVNNGNLLLTSFTEGVMHDREVLKQPIHTSITIDHKEFDVMDVDEDVQLTFGLREFKALGSLCDLLNTDVSVSYGEAGKPLLVDFEKDGMTGSFVVATTTDSHGSSHRSKPMAGSGRNNQYQPRTISNRTTFEREPAAAEAEERGERTWREPSARGSRHRQQSPDPSGQQQSLSQDFDRSALFAPDPDAEDEAVLEQRSRMSNAANERDLSMHHSFDPQEHAAGDDYREDEMRLYAEEVDFTAYDDPPDFGPTQTQNTNKPRGLFD